MIQKGRISSQGSTADETNSREMNPSGRQESFVLPPSWRPTPILHLAQAGPKSSLPVVDLASLHDHSRRPGIIDQIERACKGLGCFLVTNHGVPQSLIEDAFGAASDFFNLPVEEKMPLSSSDVNKPVRYGTGFNQARDQICFWRYFLKHYSHPLSKWISSWPTNPPAYRNKMGKYAEAMQELAAELMKAIFGSLGSNPDFFEEEMAEGSQVIVLNSYPPCLTPELVLGIPPHTDFGLLTILSQSCEGLEVLDKEGKWLPVPAINGALVVHVADHLEVLTNGRYKAVMHRAFANSHNARLSIASLDKLHPAAYRESSFQDFLDYLTANDIVKGKRFIETLKTSIVEEAE